jgi:hypothetical protein
VWLFIAKKGADAPVVSYARALESALCFGWIDGQGPPRGDQPQLTSDRFWAVKSGGRMSAVGRSGALTVHFTV